MEKYRKLILYSDEGTRFDRIIPYSRKSMVYYIPLIMDINKEYFNKRTMVE